MEFGTYTISNLGLAEVSNQAKEVIMSGLVSEGFLTKDQAQDISYNYAVVIHSKGWMGRLFDKIRGVGDKSIMTFVRAVECEDIEYEEDEHIKEDETS